MKTKSIYVLILFLLFSCTPQEQQAKIWKKKNENIFLLRCGESLTLKRPPFYYDLIKYDNNTYYYKSQIQTNEIGLLRINYFNGDLEIDNPIIEEFTEQEYGRYDDITDEYELFRWDSIRFGLRNENILLVPGESIKAVDDCLLNFQIYIVTLLGDPRSRGIIEALIPMTVFINGQSIEYHVDSPLFQAIATFYKMKRENKK